MPVKHTLLITLLALLIGGSAVAESKSVTATGWFADDGCARGRASSGVFTSTNPECAKKCIARGAKLVFIAEKEKAVWLVRNPESLKQNIGSYVQVAGTLDPAAGAVNVDTVKTLAEVNPSCSIPKSKKAH